MSRIFWIAAFLVLCQSVSLRAETFTLTSGEILSGEAIPTSAKNEGVQLRLENGSYKMYGWGRFSQDSLKKLASIPKLAAYAEPFITPPVPLKPRKVFVPHLKEVSRLDRPQGGSLLNALFSTSLGMLALFAIYVANIYAGYEVAIFRMRPPALVAGLAAIPVLGFLATAIFLALPSQRMVAAGVEQEATVVAELSQSESQETGAAPVAEAVVNPMQSETAPHPTGLRLAHSEPTESSAPQHPQTVVYQRGQFTFNRRFFETKFGGFFGIVRRDAERDMVLVIKAARGEYTGNRITRIAANDLHLQVQRGGASEEVMIPFGEISEIRLKHKDAVA